MDEDGHPHFGSTMSGVPVTSLREGETGTPRVQSLAEAHFRSSMLPLDPGHHPRSCGRINYINHGAFHWPGLLDLVLRHMRRRCGG